MRIYVEAYDANLKQVLGNLDGQTSWSGRAYKRTDWYKGLLKGRKTARVALWRIVNDKGHVLEDITNCQYQKA